MEFLNEKRIKKNGKPMAAGDVLLEEKICFVEQKMHTLKENCVRLYGHHYYERNITDYDETIKKAGELWREISNFEWTEHAQILSLFQAKAACLLGSVFAEKQDYDKALSYLTEGWNRMEKGTLEYLIPEFYVRSAIEMAKCYIEKHSPVEVTKSCLEKARDVLKARREEICENYPAFYYEKLTMELTFQRLFVAMDRYIFEQEENTKDAWKLLKEILEQYGRLPGAGRSEVEYGFVYADWKTKQEVSLQTTKGELLKNLYFTVGEEIQARHKNKSRSPKKGSLSTVVTIFGEEVRLDPIFSQAGGGFRKERLDPFLQKISRSVTESGREPEWNDEELEEMQRCCLEMTFSVFASIIKKYPKNTICLDDLAALLYDYRHREDRDEDRERAGKWAIESETVLSDLIRRYLCEEDQRETVDQTINVILDRVLEVEETNMFALSIKAELTMPEQVSDKIDDYPALRQSSLKRWFIRMSRIGIPGGQLQAIELCLIRLYRYVTRFMNHAIIDWKSEEWKDLEVGHYTKMEVLPLLYNKNPDTRLRIHNVHHLNDPLEGVIFIDRLKEHVKAPGNGKDSLIRSLWELYDSDRDGAVRNTVYMGSFTSRLDHLNMWERYGDHQKGVALQFDGKAYFDKEAKISFARMSTSGNYGRYKIEDIRYPLYMVIYLKKDGTAKLSEALRYANVRKDAEKELNENGEKNVKRSWWEMQEALIWELGRLEEEIETCLDEMQEIQEKIDGYVGVEGFDKEKRDQLRDEICYTIMVILDLVRFLVKSDKYRDEREFRVIQYSDDPECEEGTEVPRLYIPIDKEPVYKKVCFGPLVTEFESKAAYVLNIRRNGAEVKVQKSTISFKEG